MNIVAKYVKEFFTGLGIEFIRMTNVVFEAVAVVLEKFSLRGYGIPPGSMPSRYRRKKRLPYAAMKVWQKERQMERPLAIKKVRDYVIIKKI